MGWLKTHFSVSALWTTIILISAFVAANVAADESLRPSPPKMVKQPSSDPFVFFVAHEPDDIEIPFLLECEADGEPQPTYRWFKNGNPFQWESHDDRIIKQPGRGTLVITQTSSIDEGHYECRASNKYGTAISRIDLKEAVFETLPNMTTVEKIVKEGDPLTLLAVAPKGFPKPIVTWVTQKPNGAVHHIYNSRITVDPVGNLHFSNVTREDGIDEYVCAATIATSYIYKTGNSFRISVIDSEGNPTKHTQQLLYTSPPETIVLQGNNVEIYCVYGGMPLPEIKWNKDKKELPTDPRYELHDNGSVLKIENASYQDGGSYECVATTPDGQVVRTTVTSVVVQSAPVWETDPTMQVDYAGKSARFECKTSGVPEPQMEWFKNGAPFKDAHADSHETTHHTSYLQLDGLKTSEIATYQCKASNIHGTVFKSFYLDPGSFAQRKFDLVQLYSSASNLVGLLNDSLQIHCIYGGSPIPEVHWSKLNSNLSPDRYTLLNFNKTLKITKVAIEDAGTYQCSISNGVTSPKTKSITVTVHSAPRWKSEPKDILAAEGDTVNITCLAEGSPEPEVQWFVNGHAITKDNTRGILLDAMATTLRLKSVKVEDTAVYQCNASNMHGYIFQNAFVHVVDRMAPEITEPPAVKYQVIEDLTVTLTCRIFGAPRPTVTWMKNGKDLTDGRHVMLANGDLEIRHARFSDAGYYRCKAGNSFGYTISSETSGYLYIRERTRITRPPKDYEVAAGQTATFQCRAVGDLYLDIVFEWSRGGQILDPEADARISVADYGNLSIAESTQLDAGVYTCTAKTRLDSTSAKAELIVQDVPDPPLLLGVKCNRLEALVDWKPMKDNGSPILSFSIHYNTSHDPGTWETAFDGIPASDAYFAVSMSPGTLYSFRVVARNKIGDSYPSQHSDACQTPDDVPYKNPDGVRGKGTTPNNLVISWEPMPPIEHNSRGFFYRVYYRRDQPNAEWQLADVEDWRQHQYEVHNQPTFVRYRIKVEAYNRFGAANVTAVEVQAYSGEDVPLVAPENFSLLQIVSGTTAEVEWGPVPVEFVRGHFKGYKIKSWADDINNFHETIVDARVNKVILKTLRPDSVNNVQVHVVNSHYEGPPSKTVTFTTPVHPSGLVREFDAVPMGNNALYLMWLPPTEPNGELTGYRIYYQTVRGSQIGPLREALPMDPDVTTMKLPHLVPETKYRISIRAINSEGEGDPYFIESNTTVPSGLHPITPSFTWRRLLSEHEGRTNIKVVWLPLKDKHEGNPGSFFYVQYRKKGDNRWERSADERNSVTTVIPNLESGTVYDVRVVSVGGEYQTASDVQEIIP